MHINPTLEVVETHNSVEVLIFNGLQYLLYVRMFNNYLEAYGNRTKLKNSVHNGQNLTLFNEKYATLVSLFNICFHHNYVIRLYSIMLFYYSL